MKNQTLIILATLALGGCATSRKIETQAMRHGTEAEIRATADGMTKAVGGIVFDGHGGFRRTP